MKKVSYISKRMVVCIGDCFAFSIIIMIALAITLHVLESLKILMVPKGFVGFELMFTPPPYNYGTTFIFSPITRFIGSFIELFSITNPNQYDGALRGLILMLTVISLRTFLVSLYEIRHQGYSKVGKKLNLRIVGDKSPYTFRKACLRNLIKFTGGCGLFFIPCCLPAFDGTNRTMMDKVFKIRVIEEKYTEKVIKTKRSIYGNCKTMMIINYIKDKKKRVFVFLRDIFAYSFCIVIVLFVVVYLLESKEVLEVASGTYGLRYMSTPYYVFITSMGLISIKTFVNIISNMLYYASDSFQFENALENFIFVFLTISIRSILVSIYEIRHNGYSKAGRKANLRIVGNGKSYTLKKALLRNFIKFSGGLGLFFIPCFLPAFDGTDRTMLDKVFKVRVIEEVYPKKI